MSDLEIWFILVLILKILSTVDMLQAKIYMKLLILSKRMENYKHIKNNLKHEN